jgi:hypothetical protein
VVCCRVPIDPCGVPLGDCSFPTVTTTPPVEQQPTQAAPQKPAGDADVQPELNQDESAMPRPMDEAEQDQEGRGPAPTSELYPEQADPGT